MPTSIAEPAAAPLCFETGGLTKVYGAEHSAVRAPRGIDLELPERELGGGRSAVLILGRCS